MSAVILRSVRTSLRSVNMVARTLSTSQPSMMSMDGTQYKDRERAAEAAYIRKREEQMLREKREKIDHSAENVAELRRLAGLTECADTKTILEHTAAEIEAKHLYK